MAAAPTTFAPLTAAQFAARIAAAFPPGWSSPDAKMPGGNLYKLMVAEGAELSFELGALTYALNATRLATAVDGALDAASVDYFGTKLPYALPRNPGELDPAFSARLLAAMLPTADTRAAISAAIQKVVGIPPRLVEPWQLNDCGVYSNATLEPGAMFYSVDTTANPGRYSSAGLAYQGFVQTQLPTPQVFGPNPTPCYSVYTMNYNVAGSSMFDPPGSATAGAQSVYNVINRTKVFGTAVWVQFLPPPSLPGWLPTINGNAPTIAANFATQGYWYANASYTSFSSWLAAVGGSYTRSTTASYLQGGVIKSAAINTPRFPTTLAGVPTGVRITGPTTNQLIQSNTFSNAAWGPAVGATAGATTSPDGTSNGWSIVSGIGATQGMAQTVSGAVTGARQTLTFHVKQLTSTEFFASAFDGTGSAHIYLAHGVWTGGVPVMTTAAGAGSSVVTPLAGGWFRIEMTFTGTAGHNFQAIFYPQSTNAGTCTGLGNYTYGWQLANLNQGADYVATTTVAVTQAADILTVPWSVTIFSARAVVVNQTAASLSNVPRIIGTDTSSAGPLFIVPNPGTGYQFGTWNGGVSLLLPSVSDPSGAVLAAKHKIMSAGVSGSSIVTRTVGADGGAVQTDANGYIPPFLGNFYIGNSQGTIDFAYGDFTEIDLWSGQVATSADIVRLTT